MASSFIYLLIAAMLLLTGVAACAVDLRARRRTQAQLGKVLEAIGALRGEMTFQPTLSPAPSEPAPATPAEVPEGLLPPWLKQDLYEAARKVGSKPVKLLQLAVALQLRQAREQGEPTSGVLSGIKIPEDVVDDTAAMFAEDYAEQIPEEPAEMVDEETAPGTARDGEDEGGRVTPTLISEKPPSKPKPFS